MFQFRLIYDARFAWTCTQNRFIYHAVILFAKEWFFFMYYPIICVQVDYVWSIANQKTLQVYPYSILEIVVYTR